MGDYLTMHEKRKYNVIKAVVNKQKSIERAEVELSLGRRQINRLVQLYKNEGRKGFRHGNAGTSPSNRTTDELRKKIVDLYNTTYDGFNFAHFTEKLNDVENIDISESSVRNYLKAAGILSPKARRKTKRDMRKQLKEKAESKAHLTVREQAYLEEMDPIEMDKPHPTRSRKKYAGELLQMDASDHVWFGEKRSFLHGAIDDATGLVVGAYFEEQETLKGYYEVTEQFLTKYGVPYQILTDKRTVFYSSKKEESSLSDQKTLTQYGYMCQNLGINLESTSNPQKKGRIERLWQTFQDRLLNEMRLANINTIEQANTFVLKYINVHNTKFGHPLKDNMSVWEKLDESTDINLLLCRHDFRVVTSGNAIQYHTKTYRLLHENGTQALLPPKTKVMTIESKDHNLYASYRDKLYLLEEIPKHEAFSKALDMPVEPKKTRRYIPPMSHPWKSANYQKYINKLEAKETVGT